jgi:hypothetical protein
MPMTLECAYFIVRTHHRLVKLVEAAKAANLSARIIADLRAKRDKVGLFVPNAAALVIGHSDSEFKAAAKKIKTYTDKIDAAIADIRKIDQALTAAASLINKISGLLGVAL